MSDNSTDDPNIIVLARGKKKEFYPKH